MKHDNTLFPKCLSKILDDKNAGLPTCGEGKAFLRKSDFL